MDQIVNHLLHTYREIYRKTNPDKDINPDALGEDIADWLWLAAHTQPKYDSAKTSPPDHVQEEKQTSLSKKEETPSLNRQSSDITLASTPVAPEAAPPTNTELDLHTTAPRADGIGSGGLPMRTPGARALPQSLAIARALRPLLKRVPNRNAAPLLDEETSVQRMADSTFWMPVFKSATMPWLDLALVIDDSPSMRIWRQTIVELSRLLTRQGAFRDVRIWKLRVDKQTLNLHVGVSPAPRHYRELISPSSTRLILIVTDCISSAWASETLCMWLNAWAGKHPTALLQMLPQRLWGVSHLARARLEGVRSGIAATPNTQLEALRKTPTWVTPRAGETPFIPLTSLEPEELSAWAKFTTGYGATKLPAFAFSPWKNTVTAPGKSDTSIPDRYERFRSVATPTAFKLACFLAAAPLRLPIMRLVQQQLVPKSNQTHLAEFFLSGMLKRISVVDENTPEDIDQIEYDFIDDAHRHKLLDAGLITDAVEVQQHISDYIAEYHGVPNFFQSIINDPKAIGDLCKPQGISTFAKVSAEVLSRLGGRYAALAKRLKENGGDEQTKPALHKRKHWSVSNKPKKPASRFFPAIFAKKHAVENGRASTQWTGAAIGVGGVYVGRANGGTINTGTRIANNYEELEELERQIAEMQAKLAAARQTATTGSRIQGNVQIQNGDFIGRDFIQITTQITYAGEDPEEAKSVVAHYLTALANNFSGLELSGIDKSAAQPGQKPLDLKDIYVPLSTTQLIPADLSLKQWLSTETGQREHRAATGKTQRVTALEALAEHRELTLLGKPGSGKSIFGATVLLTLAQAWRDGQPPELGATWTHGALLPIRVILRRFAEQLPPGGEMAQASDLWDFIGADLDAGYGLSGRTMEYVQRIVRDHGALILFDGLDECGDNTRRRRVLNAVNDLMRSAGPKCRFVLTARPYAWHAGPDPARGVYALDDLSDAQIEQFIHAWYAALAQRGWLSPNEAERKKEDLLKVRLRPDLLPLAQNPLLLTLMTTLHTNRGRLPDDRADLYNDSVELLMLRWNRQIGADRALLDKLDIPGLKLSDLREVLEALAFRIHERNVDHDGAADIGEDALVRAFLPLLRNSRDKAADVVEYIEKRAGLLVGQGETGGERQFSFQSRTFQEFLAACHLAAKDNFAAECVRLARAAAAHWQVVLPLAARLAKAERGAGAADALIHGVSIRDFAGQPDAIDWACTLLAGNQLLEIGLGALNTGEHTRAIAARVTGWIAAGLPLHPDEGGAEALQRAQAGDMLVALGDPRFDPQCFHLPKDRMLGFVLIPADPDFCIGTRRADAQRMEMQYYEINDQPTPTPDFYLARYPVTAAQFRVYVADGGNKLGNNAALFAPDNRPVPEVSWHEALAYCDWLNTRLAALPDNRIAQLIRDGWRIGLPSELEWEKAARGGLRDKVYPWGDDADANCANYSDTGIGATSAVGCFPANDYGLHDMSGNVWEWTRSLDWAYPYRPEDGREKPYDGKRGERVVRGGGWGNHADDVRCAYRSRRHPDDHLSDIGFRVVLRFSPV